MSILETLKNKLASEPQLQEIGQPMLERIGDRISGGIAHVWCRAQWGSGCDYVNIAKSQL